MTDVFDKHLSKAQERHNPHSLENAVYKLTDYAQLKNDAQARNGIAADNTAQTAEPMTDNLEPAADDKQEATGDANPDHGYESDGDVKMVSEQDTVKEVQAQTDFAESDPEAQALDPRHRDAESHLSERMGHNHSLNKTDPNSATAENGLGKTVTVMTDITDSEVEKANSHPEWKDGLRRDENDKV